MALLHRLTRQAAATEARLDRWRRRLRRHLGWVRPPTIQPYLGYGTADHLQLHGRVLEDPRIEDADPGASRWGNLRAMLKRYASREIPGARLRARFEGRECEVRTDDEGYFDVLLPVPGRPRRPEHRWRDVQLELLAPRRRDRAPVLAIGRVLVPPRGARYGVISDVDDTIVRTGATNLLRHARTVLFNSAHTRVPFPGVSAFYQALERGDDGAPTNPMFYVSSSPWNVFDVFHEFMRLREIPEGPIFLKDYGLEPGRLLKSGHGAHKCGWIDRLFAAYPELPWILVGDSGQQDAFIYADIVARHPGRVLAVYLRDVGLLQRRRTIAPAMEAIERCGVPVVLDADTAGPAAHAAAQGWIAPVERTDVERRAAQDR